MKCKAIPPIQHLKSEKLESVAKLTTRHPLSFLTERQSAHMSQGVCRCLTSKHEQFLFNMDVVASFLPLCPRDGNMRLAIRHDSSRLRYNQTLIFSHLALMACVIDLHEKRHSSHLVFDVIKELCCLMIIHHLCF